MVIRYPMLHSCVAILLYDCLKVPAIWRPIRNRFSNLFNRPFSSGANEEQVTCRMKRGRLWVQLTAQAAYKTGIPFAGACFSGIRPPVVNNRGRAVMRRREAFPCTFALSVLCCDKRRKRANDYVRQQKIAAFHFLAPRTGPSFTHSARTDKVLLP